MNSDSNTASPSCGRSWLCTFLALAALAIPARALTTFPPWLTSNVLVFDGAVFFCRPDSSLAILDLSSGEALVDDPRAKCDGWFLATAYGPLLSMSGTRIRMIDLAGSVAARRLVTSWEAGTETWGCSGAHLGTRHLLCGRRDNVMELRSLRDGRPVWSYQARGSVNDIIERDGRLMLQSGDYKLARNIVWLEYATGAELARHAVEMDASFSVRSFDGREVVLETARAPVALGCPGRSTRVLRLQQAGGITVHDQCEAGERRPNPLPWGMRLEEEMKTWLAEHGAPDGKAPLERTWRREPVGGYTMGLVGMQPGVLLVLRMGSRTRSLERLEPGSGRRMWVHSFAAGDPGPRP